MRYLLFIVFVLTAILWVSVAWPIREIPNPEYYGVYGIEEGKLSPLAELESGKSLNVFDVPHYSPKVTFVIFDKNVRSGVPRIELRGLIYVRKRVHLELDTEWRGWDYFKRSIIEEKGDYNIGDIEDEKKWHWIEAKESLVQLRSRPVRGQPEMVQLVPSTPLEPGWYNIKILSGGRGLMPPRRRIFSFAVEFEKVQKEKVCYDLYVRTDLLSVLGQREFTYQPCSVLSQLQEHSQRKPVTKNTESVSSSRREKNLVVPPGKPGQFLHGTLVVKDAGGSLRLAASPTEATHTHPGIDIVADCGSPIYASSDGFVIDVIDSEDDQDWGIPGEKGLGYTVLVKHDEPLNGRDTFSIYLHMRGPPRVKVGQDVKGGETVLGHVGKTGFATGCHAHFEIRHFYDPASPNPRYLNHPEWNNIYGKGDQRNKKVFLDNWEDPCKVLRLDCR